MKLTRIVLGSVVLLQSFIGCSSQTPTGGSSRGGGPRAGMSTSTANQSAAGSAVGAPGTNGGGLVLPSTPRVTKLPDGVCAGATVTANRIIPTVYLVVDGSSSMNAPFGGGTRWSVLREALVGANGVVTKLESAVMFGMTIYGNSNPMACPQLVEVKPPALNNLMTMSGMYPMVETGGGTPTGEALQGVVDSLPDFSEPVLDGPQPKAPIIILATDGEPNGCNEALAAAATCATMSDDLITCLGDLVGQLAAAPANYDTTLKAVTTARDKMIPVWVISLAAGLNNIPDLQRTANIGAGLDDNAMPGATIYSPQNPDDLTNTLIKLIGDVVDCTVELNGTLDVARACEGTVNINGMPLSCGADEGWKPVDSKHIALQGMACATFKSDPSVFLDARFPCGVVTPD
ncbi:MAG TPA: vWA domain-containing protein [Polyangiales bacterium]|nr:vWA domain-containing protein [Polyangiales bacterium]